MKLTISPDTIPSALIPLAACASAVGLPALQLVEFCRSGQLEAVEHGGRWWVSVAALTAFVERSRWQFLSPPEPPQPTRGRILR